MENKKRGLRVLSVPQSFSILDREEIYSYFDNLYSNLD